MWEQRQREALASQGLTSADVSDRIEQMRRGREEAADLVAIALYTSLGYEVTEQSRTIPL
jgi:hypothetical protein